MRTTSKIVLAIILIILVYSLAKLISASSMGAQQPSIKTWPVNESEQNIQNNQNQAVQSSQTTNVQNTSQGTSTTPTVPNVPPTPDTPNAQGLYQADEILIDGQGKAGSNYIDITSDTPITPQTQNNASTQNNNYNGGGAYAQASVNIDNNNNTSTSVQTYAPGVPAFEVLDGN